MVSSKGSAKNASLPGLFAGRFEILAPLGTGFVGEVYRARDTQDSNDKDGKIALKVLRSGQDPLLIKNEALILQALWREEEKLGDGFHAAPRLFHADPDAPRPFLAMEFISGKKIPDLIRESDARYFEEPLALNVAAQLFRLLSIVHERLNKTYTDLKMENLWWVTGDSPLPWGGELKVTDWNVLEERRIPANKKRDPVSIDLFRASLSFYWMLTGRLPDLHGNLSVKGIKRAPNWGIITDGAKTLLNDLLETHNLETALQVKIELDRLIDYWKSDTSDLIAKANQTALTATQPAIDIVSVLKQRIKEPDKELMDLENKLRDAIRLREDPDKSIALFGGGSYLKAMDLAEQAEIHSVQPHVFRWWRRVIALAQEVETQIKKSNPDSVSGEKLKTMREIVVKSLRAYLNAQYQDAEQYFVSLSEYVGSTENQRFSDLLKILQIQHLYMRAELTRESGHDEERIERQKFYKESCNWYTEALSMSKEAESDLLPTPLLPESIEAGLEDLKSESNEAKAVIKLHKGNEQFNNGLILAAHKSWGEAFELDPDQDELIDSVLLATRKTLDNALQKKRTLYESQGRRDIVLENSEKLALVEEINVAADTLAVIPSLVSNYIFTCIDLRKRINAARQEVQELSSSQQFIPVSPLAPSQDESKIIKKDDWNYQAQDNKIVTTGAKKRPGRVKKVMPSLPGEAVIVPAKETTNNKALSRPKVPNRIHKSTSRVKTPAVSDNAEQQQPAYRLDRLIKIRNNISNAENNNLLTIDMLNRFVREANSILRRAPDMRADKENFNADTQRLHKAKSRWDEAQNLPLDERIRIVDELRKMKFVGKKDRFDTELGLTTLNEVLDARKMSSLPYFDKVVHLMNQGFDIQTQGFLEKEVEAAKNRILEEACNDATPHFLWPALLKLQERWPDDAEIQKVMSEVMAKVRQNSPDPEGWKNIEYFRDLARLAPLTCKRKLEAFIKYPKVEVCYGKEVREIFEKINRIEKTLDDRQSSLIGRLEKAFTLGMPNKGDEVTYRDEIRKILQDFHLTDKAGWNEDEYIRLYMKLKGGTA